MTEIGAEARAPPSPEKPQRTLEYWLTRATDPYVGESLRQEHVRGFVEQLNAELEGPQIATKLLAHKIQSPFEVEALHSLEVLDACVKNCGLRFHNEIAKFRFLNELIRILSPKYLGGQTADRVKQRAVELMYGWRRTMPHLGKISQAYDMLKTQGIIGSDPVYMDAVLEAEPPPPVPEERAASFEDSEKSRLLSELLRSKRPDDLIAANRLIKSMVKAEDQKMEKVAKRGGDLQTAAENARLLAEMVGQFRPQSPVPADVEIMRELATSLTTLRPGLFRYAGEAAEGEEAALAQVLTVNDDVSKAIDDFRNKVDPHTRHIPAASPAAGSAAGPSNPSAPLPSQGAKVADLLEGLELGSSSSAASPPSLLDALSTGQSELLPTSQSDLSVAASDDVSMIGGSATPLVARRPQGQGLEDLLGGGSGSAEATPPATVPQDIQALIRTVKTAQSTAAAEAPGAGPACLLSGAPPGSSLDALSDDLILRALPAGTAQSSFQTKRTTEELRSRVPLKELHKPPSPAHKASTASNGSADEQMLGFNTSPSRQPPQSQTPSQAQKPTHAQAPVPAQPSPPHAPPAQAPKAEEPASSNHSAASSSPLDGVSVPLTEIQPGKREPMTLVERKGLKVILHLAGNRPKPSVGVLVLHISSSLPSPVTGLSVTFRSGLVRAEAASGEALAAFNPILPQAPLTQILYLRLSDDEELELDYTLDYEVDNSERSMSGSVRLRRDYFA